VLLHLSGMSAVAMKCCLVMKLKTREWYLYILGQVEGWLIYSYVIILNLNVLRIWKGPFYIYKFRCDWYVYMEKKTEI
jgi:hypothetical protein